MDDKEFIETQLKAFCEAYQVPEKDKPKVRDFLEKLRNLIINTKRIRRQELKISNSRKNLT